MAHYKKPAIAIAVVIIAGGIAALSAPILEQRQINKNELSAFGIKSTESVFGYQRQSAFAEVSEGRYRIAPPRPEAAFSGYELSADPATNKICAVYASTEDEPALTRLRAKLAQTYGEPTVTPEQGWRWAKDNHFVEIEDLDGRYQVSWNFTGTCGISA